MAKWIPEPALDKGQVGLGFISVGYGVVLVAVFPAKASTLPHTGAAGLTHLVLAAVLLATSWMGYYTNRERFPVWKVQFFNIPLFQYLISFGILFAYWELGITVEKPGSYVVPTPRSEAIIVLIVFLAYLAWDFFEITVQEKCKYARVLIHSPQAALCPPTIDRVQRRFHRRGVHKLFSSKRTKLFAKDLRGGRSVTIVFALGYGIGLLVVLRDHIQRSTPVVVVDCIYIASLFLYRYLQWWWPNWWYLREVEEQ